MIQSSPSLKAGLIVVSAVAHAAVAYALFSEPQVQIAGGTDVIVEARLGNSFEDLAAGADQPEISETPEVEPIETEASEPPTGSDEVEPVETKRVETVEETAEIMPEETPRSEAEITETANREEIEAPRAPIEVLQEAAKLAAQSAPPKRFESLRPSVNVAVPVLPIEARPVETTLPSPAPSDLAEPAKVEELTEVQPDVLAALTPPPPEPAPLTTLTPQNPSEEGFQATPEPPLAAAPPTPETLTPSEDRAVEASPRPQERPERKTRETRREQPRSAPQGNSNRNATAGSATGSQTATSTRQSTNTGQSTASGNAAVSNYPGLVMREISRVRKPRVGSRGTATIRFSISASGGLASVVVARSSGNARLDRAALQVIQKAAPFPKPPQGARRNFSIQIQGRG